MSYPGSTYAIDKDGSALVWNAVRPPYGWTWCPRKDRSKVDPHYKPDDGARCLFCGYDPEHPPTRPEIKLCKPHT